MTTITFAYGEEVVFLWGIQEVRGTVHEIYGSGARRQVVVMLTPSMSGYVADEPTTVVIPLDEVRRASDSN